jgi:hypothetical protein
MSREMAWKTIAARMARLLARDASRAWEPVEEILHSGDGRPAFGLLLRASQLAAQYGEADLARAGVERHRAFLEQGGSLDRGARAAFQAIHLAIDLASKSYGRAAAALRALDWSELPPDGWAYNVRLLATTRENDHRAVLDLLGRPPAILEPYERGNRLRILGRYFLLRGRWDRVAGFFRAALREYARDGAADARLKEVEILGILGSAAAQEGRWAEAEDLLGRAVREAARLAHPFYEPSFRIELAQLAADRGDDERAASMLRIVCAKLRRRTRRSGADRFLLVAALLAAGSVSADSGLSADAEAALVEAGALLAADDHPRLRAYWHLLRGRVLALLPDAGAQRLALVELDEAERAFRGIGDGDLLGLSRVALHRGHIHLGRREILPAIERSLECMEFARAGGFLPIQARCLLLESQLLLQREVPGADRLYEEVLTSLGSIHDPVVLFKVIANLYLHSWELGDQVDLTDYHLRQIHKMAEVLDRDTFRDLYERHVSMPVAQRVLARAFGVVMPPPRDGEAG